MTERAEREGGGTQQVTDAWVTQSEVDALRAWRRDNGLPEIADPPLHWSDVPIDHDQLWDCFYVPFRHVLTVLADLRRKP